MDNLVGKWKMDHSTSENWEAYATALKVPEEMIKKFAEMKIVSETTKNEDGSFTTATTYDDYKDTLTFRLDVPFTSSPMGIETENTLTMEGDVLVGTHKCNGKTTVSRRFLQGDKLVNESVVDGIKWHCCFTRC